MIIEHPKISDIPALRELWKEAFSDTDTFLDSFFSLAFSPERALVIRESEDVLAALYWLDCSWNEKKVAYIYAVATKKAHRGKGLCKALMTELHNRVKRTILVPADEGLRAFYSRLGYRDFGGMEELLCYPGGTAVMAEKLTAESYAQMRRKMIPVGGVLQEGLFLPFLEENLDFYGGDGWLLAIGKENGKGFAPEFLGDKTLLSGILKGLQYKEARVRSPGKTPFAMYRSADGENSLPGYFAFALD